MMRSLVLTLNSATPTSGGAGIRNAQTVRSLARHGPVDVFALGVTDQGNSPDAAATCSWSWADLAEGRQLRDQLALRTWPLRPGGHWRQDMYRSTGALQALNQLVADREPRLIVGAGWQTGVYARAVRSGRVLVLDTHNVEADLQRGIGGERVGRASRDFRRLATCERRFGRLADQVWVCSSDDARLWRDVHGEAGDVVVLPNVVPTGQLDAGSERLPHRLLLTGTFSYPPNIAAARELVHEILPIVRLAIPDAEVDLVGREPAPEVLELATCAGVTVTGAVPDVAPYLERSTVMVVPLREGGGTRLKILEAMAAGLPVVSTLKGVEGIEARAGTHLLIGNSPDEIADSVAALCSDRGRASDIAAAASDLVKRRYSEAALDTMLDEALDRAGLV